MTYLISEIALFLLLALALGLVVGWLLRGLVASKADTRAARGPENVPEVGADPLPPPPEPEPEAESAEQIWP